MKTILGIGIAVVLVLGGGWIAHRSGVPLPFVGGDSTAASGLDADEAAAEDAKRKPSAVIALGWIEPAGGVVEISGTPGDRIESILVAEGDPVQPDQAMVYLASRAIHQLEIATVESQIIEAEARSVAEKNLANARRITAELGVEQVDMKQMDKDSLKRKIALLKANLRLARKDRERLENLSDDLISEQQRERQGLLVEQAEAELASAEAESKKFARTLDFSRRAAEADLNAARAGEKQVEASIPVESLKRQLEMAQARLRQSEIRASSKGTVLRVFMEPGESIGRKPILQLADLERMVAVAEVYETDVKRIEPGQAAVVNSRAFRSPYDEQGLNGEVERVGRLITTPELKSLDPFARADRHVVPVRVLLDEQSSRQAADFSNLQVDVAFPIVDGAPATSGLSQPE